MIGYGRCASSLSAESPSDERDEPFPWLALHEPGNAFAQAMPSPSGGRASSSTVRLVGDDCVVWASDYPHPDAHFPGAVSESVKKMAGVSEASRHKIFATNALRLYNLA